jgi:hypothetical protein
MGELTIVAEDILSGYSIVGMVLAVSLAILIMTGFALYLAFRLRDTFRERGSKGASIVKLVFLIGLLFMVGGVFYFFSSGIHLSCTWGPPTVWLCVIFFGFRPLPGENRFY